MFNEYYLTKVDDELIYVSLITINNNNEVSLYKGNKIFERKSVDKGIHTIVYENIKLTIEIRLLKLNVSLFIDNEEQELKKIKRKELKQTLNELGYFNEINPNPAQIKPFNYKGLIVPSFIILFGGIMYILTKDMSKIWFIFNCIIFIIGYIMFTSPFFDKIPTRHLDDAIKIKLKLAIGILLMGATQDILHRLF